VCKIKLTTLNFSVTPHYTPYLLSYRIVVDQSVITSSFFLMADIVCRILNSELFDGFTTITCIENKVCYLVI